MYIPKECPFCGAYLDPAEKCDCQTEGRKEKMADESSFDHKPERRRWKDVDGFDDGVDIRFTKAEKGAAYR